MIDKKFKQQTNIHVIIILNLGVMLWGFSGLFGKWIDYDPSFITFWRMFIAWAFMLLIYIIRNKGFEFNKALAFKNFGCGILLVCHWVSFFAVIKLSNVAIGFIFHASFVFFIAIMEPLFLRTKINPKSIALSIIGLIGLFFAAAPGTLNTGSFFIWFYGLSTALTYTLISIINRTALINEDPLNCTTGQFFYGSLILLPFIFYNSDVQYIFSASTLTKLLFLGVFATAVAHTIYFWSLRKISSVKASFFVLLEPVYGIFLAAILLNETPSTLTIIGCFIIFVTAIFAQKTNKKL